MTDQYDVAVIGGGPVGAALALDLGAAQLKVALIEAREPASAVSDARPLALSYGSRLILERLDVWKTLPPATPIARIHVSQRGAFGRAVLTSAQAGLPALGYVIDYSSLVAALDSAVAAAPVRAIRGARVYALEHEESCASIQYESAAGVALCTASLVVVADGSALASAAGTRTRDYEQSAITARVSTTLPHGNTAYERFTPEGPIALLPLAGDYALVWTVRREEAETLSAAPEHDFLGRLQERFGERIGRFTTVTGRAAHPLVLRVAERTRLPRTILVGNAAQALHPVAGQGLNLGLRDAFELAAEVRRLGPAADRLPAAYRARRRIDRAAGIAFTDTLARLFSNERLPLALARGAGLALLDVVPPAKDFFVRRMIFGTRG